MSDLTGKVALITGAGSGIGRATSYRFAQDGAAVMCADIDEQSAQQTAAGIAEHGGRAAALKLDVSVESEVKEALQRTVRELGGFDVLFNNAGVGGGNGWERLLAINLTGVYFGLYHGANLLAERGGGAIVSTASVAGLVGLLGYNRPALPESASALEAAIGGYVATKHGVVGLTRQFAITFATRGVRVNAVAPGYIRTPMTQGMTSVPEAEQFISGLHPLGRLGEPEEIAAAVAFLASDDASFISGVTLPVDGGYTAR